MQARRFISLLCAKFGRGRRLAQLHQELIDLIASGDEAALISRLDAGVPSEALNHPDAPPLIFWAAAFRRHRMVEPLLAAGVEHRQEWHWDTRIIRGANPFVGVTVLHWAEERRPWLRLFSLTSRRRPRHLAEFEHPATLLMDTSALSLLLARYPVHEAYQRMKMKWMMRQGDHTNNATPEDINFIPISWIQRRFSQLWGEAGVSQSMVRTGRVGPIIPILSPDDADYATAMAAVAALLRQGWSPADPLAYGVVSGRLDIVRLVVDNCRDKASLAPIATLLTIHQSFRKTLDAIVDIWIHQIPGGPEALLSPHLFHMAARAHSIELLDILMGHARRAGRLSELVNAQGLFEPYELAFRSRQLESFVGNTAISEAIVGAQFTWHYSLPDEHQRNALRIVDMLLAAGASPDPIFALMDVPVAFGGYALEGEHVTPLRDTEFGQELLKRAIAHQTKKAIEESLATTEAPRARTRRM